jgi:hypothetical protein
MAERKRASEGFTDEERAAMKERAKELKAGKADGEATCSRVASMGRISPMRVTRGAP